MRRKRVADRVRADAVRNRRLADVAADDTIDAAGGETAAAQVQENGIPSSGVSWLFRVRSSNFDVRSSRDALMIIEHPAYRVRGRAPERHQPLFPALPSDAHDAA